jgi:two-component system, OmpR family, heavy metal sensor histidine kinase CusS
MSIFFSPSGPSQADSVGPAYSISQRISLRMLLITLVLLGVLCSGIYVATAALFERSQQRVLTLKINKLSETSQSLLRTGDDRYLRLLENNAQKRPGTHLALYHADGRVFYRDPDEEPHLLPAASVARSFTLPHPDGEPPLRGTFAIDIRNDVQLLRQVAVVLLLATVLGAVVASACAFFAVRQGLKPLRSLTRQTQQMAARRDDASTRQRLALRERVAELQPWIDEFNGLMGRVERTCGQLEAFNANVAHELRTPLTSLIGHTELALTRPRSPDELTRVLAENLEELQRMASLVNDMLFLSKADRGAEARRGAPVALRPVIEQVIEFHEAEAAERQVELAIEGDRVAAIDEPLFKRAASNLIANATRFAAPQTRVVVVIEPAPVGEPALLRIAVENSGPPIAPSHLPHLFDRLYRVDAARSDGGTHHGLGLAIVNAIARMHGGQCFAESARGRTRIGFSMAG